MKKQMIEFAKGFIDYFLRLFPEYRYLSRTKLYKKVREEGISKKEIKRYFKENEENKEQEAEKKAI